jgi:hypothetical protein
MSDSFESSNQFPKDVPTQQSQHFEVGYGKPPVEKRFKKGQSGNPKGRPKKRRSLEAEFNRELKLKVSINENGRRKTITKREAIVKTLVNAAIKGANPRLLLPYLEKREQELNGPITPVGENAYEQLADLTNKLRARIAKREAEKRD